MWSLEYPLKCESDLDILIIGGGLCGALVAHRCALEGRRVLIVEKKILGGNKTWSFHSSDVPKDILRWLSHFVAKSWKQHEVLFPDFRRVLEGEYHSITNEKLVRLLRSNSNICVLEGAEVIKSSWNHIELTSGEIIRARQVWDTRPFEGVLGSGHRFQKFLGQDIYTKSEHNLIYPRIMDATVSQHDGFRFVYVLPWDSRRLLVEDTYYSDNPVIETDLLRNRIAQYVGNQNWKIESIEREETGCLPIPSKMGVDRRNSDNAIGYGSGLFHPTTGYSAPMAAKTAEWIARQNREFDDRLAEKWAVQRRKLSRRFNYYCALNRLLFLAPASSRYRILENFYRLPEALIARFYSGDLRVTDFAQVLGRGKPPMPVWTALRGLTSTGYSNA